MDWKPELDALIESTMALAQDVKARSISDLALDVSAPAYAAPMTRPTSEREEILRRVSNFRAHQEKMTREREDYYLQTKAKMLAIIDPNPASGKNLA
jgi:hypothetical protein